MMENNEQTPEEPKVATSESEPEVSKTRRARKKVEETVQRVTKQTLFVSFGTFLLGMVVMFGALTFGTTHHGADFSANRFNQEQVGRSNQNNSTTGGFDGSTNNQGRSNQNGNQNRSNQNGTQNGNQNEGSSDAISGASEHT